MCVTYSGKLWDIAKNELISIVSSGGLSLSNYNYIQFHKGLRQKLNNNADKFKKHYQLCTHAMKMALTTGPLSWRFLFTVPILVRR